MERIEIGLSQQTSRAAAALRDGQSLIWHPQGDQANSAERLLLGDCKRWQAHSIRVRLPLKQVKVSFIPGQPHSVIDDFSRSPQFFAIRRDQYGAWR